MWLWAAVILQFSGVKIASLASSWCLHCDSETVIYYGKSQPSCKWRLITRLMIKTRQDCDVDSFIGYLSLGWKSRDSRESAESFAFDIFSITAAVRKKLHLKHLKLKKHKPSVSWRTKPRESESLIRNKSSPRHIHFELSFWMRNKWKVDSF